MKSDFFIDRPVFSTVLSVIIVIVGVIGLALLPIDQYPKIVPPVVKVSASYPGASAQCCLSSTCNDHFHSTVLRTFCPLKENIWFSVCGNDRHLKIDPHLI